MSCGNPAEPCPQLCNTTAAHRILSIAGVQSMCAADLGSVAAQLFQARPMLCRVRDDALVPWPAVTSHLGAPHATLPATDATNRGALAASMAPHARGFFVGPAQCEEHQDLVSWREKLKRTRACMRTSP